MIELVALAILVLAGGILALLVPFAAHRLSLLAAAEWGRRRCRRGPEAWQGELPRVTVQLPVFNEPGVVERLIDAAASLDYPRDRLDIQVLDDSTDETAERARRRVRRWRAEGVRVSHVRRGSREGYKAGALAHGLRTARGELVLILDADFLPEPDLLRRLLPPFQDPGVGMVQARWDHLNEEENFLTRAQALLLDGHFFLEHGGRHAAGRFMNFNGTAGIWRRRCIEDAGGWEGDTLTEDLDLSYRAQMRGWRFVFLEDVGVAAELPARTDALEGQQKRWARGGIQTARKLLPALLRGPFRPGIKLEGCAHLLGHLAHPLTLALGVLLFPSALARDALGLHRLLFLDLVAFALATLPFIVFYGVAARRRVRPLRHVLTRVPAALAVGVGLGATVSGAVLRGLRRRTAVFHRTPKRGFEPGKGAAPAPGAGRLDPWIRGGLLGWMALSLVGALAQGYLASLPFILLFLSGYAILTGNALGGRAPAPSIGGVRSPAPLPDDPGARLPSVSANASLTGGVERPRRGVAPSAGSTPSSR